MRLGKILALLALAVLAACSSKVEAPDHSVQALSTGSLDWQADDNFNSLIPDVDYARDELVAIFDPPGDSDQFAKWQSTLVKIAQAAGLTLLSGYDLDSTGQPGYVCGRILVRFLKPSNVSFLQAIAALQQAASSIAGVNSLYGIAPKGIDLAGSGVSTTSVGSSWGYKTVNAGAYSASGVTVAVLDTGVSPIKGLSLTPGQDFTGTGSTDDDFVRLLNVQPPIWQLGHGTGVAGLVASRAPVGVAQGATILPVKTCYKDGRCTDVEAARSLCYAASRAKVVNASFGTLLNSKLLELAARDVTASGTVIVASAGNTRDGTYIGPRNNRPAYPAYYAPNIPGLLSVGAINSKYQYADFATANASVSLVAPGVGVLTYTPQSSLDGYDGTSFAAPYVSGAVALMVAKNPTLKPADYTGMVLKTANPKGCIAGAGGSCGAGLLDINAALRMVP